jgi:O-methyltransferase / aklanonic acid methyltransferase
MGITKNGRVLDVACGTGAALVPAAEAVGAGLAVGADLSEPMLRRARGAAGAGLGLCAVVACMDAQQLAVRTESFDAVVSTFALGSLPDPQSALAECRRVTRRRGLLGLVVSDRWWWEGDDRWGWHSDLLESVGVRIEADPFPSTDIPSVLALTGWELRDHGAESFPLVFSGAGEWWAWAWSHGYRQILESMGADQIERYRREAFGHLPQNGQPVLGRLEVTLALAVRPDA